MCNYSKRLVNCHNVMGKIVKPPLFLNQGCAFLPRLVRNTDSQTRVLIWVRELLSHLPNEKRNQSWFFVSGVLYHDHNFPSCKVHVWMPCNPTIAYLQVTSSSQSGVMNFHSEYTTRHLLAQKKSSPKPVSCSEISMENLPHALDGKSLNLKIHNSGSSSFQSQAPPYVKRKTKQRKSAEKG